MAWLNRLKAVAQRMCVAPTTYAQADLDALRRVGDPGLSGIATKAPATSSTRSSASRRSAAPAWSATVR